VVDRIEAFPVTLAAGTASSTPATVATTFPDGIVVGLEVDVPPGPSGLVGFAFQQSGQQIIPRTPNSWIIVQDVHLTWPLENYPTGGKWSVVGYNTDIYSHTIQVRYLINETAPGAPTPVQLQVIG